METFHERISAEDEPYAWKESLYCAFFQHERRMGYSVEKMSDSIDEIVKRPV